MLQLGRGHHTLTCGACGAPLAKLKMMPVAAAPARVCAVSHQPAPAKRHAAPKAAPARVVKKQKRPKRRKSLLRWFAEEAFDLVEDIFD